MKKKGKKKVANPIRCIGVITGASYRSLAHGLGQVCVLRVMTAQSTFKNDLSQKEVEDVLPADVEDLRWLVGRPCRYEYYPGKRRRFTEVILPEEVM